MSAWQQGKIKPTKNIVTDKRIIWDMCVIMRLCQEATRGDGGGEGSLTREDGIEDGMGQPLRL